MTHSQDLAVNRLQLAWQNVAAVVNRGMVQ